MSIRATVIPGTQIGAKFGIATANLLLDDLPEIEEGVYLVRVQIGAEQAGRDAPKLNIEHSKFRGLLHFGPRKTFGGDFSAEVHILDFEGDLYGQVIALEIGKKLRDVQAFKNADALFTQIETDILVARKHFMRQEIWQQWQRVPLAEKQHLAHQAVKHLSQNPEFLAAEHVFAYAPQLDREISFVSELIKTFPHKTYGFPKIESGHLNFYTVTHYTDLSPGRYGLLEPMASGLLVPGSGSVLLVPSVAVDVNHYRLGQGGGYYDRFLAGLAFKAKTISVVPSFAQCEAVPQEKHDQKIDQVIVCTS